MDSMESTWTPCYEHRNMQYVLDSTWTPPGLHEVHVEYVESTWNLWGSVNYTWVSSSSALRLSPATGFGLRDQDRDRVTGPVPSCDPTGVLAVGVRLLGPVAGVSP